jgi:hypothetical protein
LCIDDVGECIVVVAGCIDLAGECIDDVGRCIVVIGGCIDAVAGSNRIGLTTKARRHEGRVRGKRLGFVPS